MTNQDMYHIPHLPGAEVQKKKLNQNESAHCHLDLYCKSKQMEYIKMVEKASTPVNAS